MPAIKPVVVQSMFRGVSVYRYCSKKILLWEESPD